MSAPQTITRSNFQNLYWSIAQQLAHHTVGGCNLQPGDLLASGTISGPAEDARGCMLELTWRGANPLQLPGGETRKWLEDGDRLTITGWCEGDGYRVGFGEVTGRVMSGTALTTRDGGVGRGRQKHREMRKNQLRAAIELLCIGNVFMRRLYLSSFLRRQRWRSLPNECPRGRAGQIADPFCFHQCRRQSGVGENHSSYTGGGSVPVPYCQSPGARASRPEAAARGDDR